MSGRRLQDKKGMVLLLTFMVMATLSAITTSFLYLTSVQIKSGGFDMVSAKALWLAEAGLQQAFYTLKNDSGYQSAPTTINGSLGEGTYRVTVVKGGSTYAFTSTGTVGSFRRQVSQSAVLSSAILARAIHADGSIVDFNGSTGTVNGNISCHVQVKNYSGMTINGTVTDGLAKINGTLDFDYYKTLAQSLGQYINGSYTFANATYTGVWYTKNQATIGDNAIINGSIISDSDIRFANRADNVQITPSALTNYPALAAKNNIGTNATGAPSSRIGLQNSTINGLILCNNNLTFDYLKNTAINGTLLSGGNISLQNSTGLTITYNENIFSPMPAGFTYTPGGATAVLTQKDWHEITPPV
jgi:hypothetical protein